MGGVQFINRLWAIGSRSFMTSIQSVQFTYFDKNINTYVNKLFCAKWICFRYYHAHASVHCPIYREHNTSKREYQNPPAPRSRSKQQVVAGVVEGKRIVQSKRAGRGSAGTEQHREGLTVGLRKALWGNVCMWLDEISCVHVICWL